MGFLSKKMSRAETRYATYDQELFALIRALEQWRRLLLTADVTAYTDHCALQYVPKLKADKPIRRRVARWLIFLSHFQNLKIVYRSAAGNVVADTLWRCPLHEGAAGKNTTNTPAGELGSRQMQFDLAKDLVFALREVKLEAEALQGAYYNGLTPVTADQQVPLWKLRVGVTAGERLSSNAKNLDKPINRPKRHQAGSFVQRLKGYSRTSKLKVTYYLSSCKVFGEFVCRKTECVGNT